MAHIRYTPAERASLFAKQSLVPMPTVAGKPVCARARASIAISARNADGKTRGGGRVTGNPNRRCAWGPFVWTLSSGWREEDSPARGYCSIVLIPGVLVFDSINVFRCTNFRRPVPR